MGCNPKRAAILLAGFLAVLPSLAGPPLAGDLASGPAAARQEGAQIAKGANGFLAVWVDARSALYDFMGTSGPYFTPGIGTMQDIYAARLDAAGNLIDTTPIVISEAPYNQSAPLVGWNGQNWLVVWMTERETDRYYHDVMMARVAPDGRVLDDPPLVLNLAGTSINWYPPFAISSDGVNWVVIWQGLDEADGGIFTIDGARVSPAGEVLDPGGQRLRHDFWNSAPSSADLAFAGDEFLLTWVELDSAVLDWVVKGQRLTPALDPIGTPFQINLYTPSTPRTTRVSTDGTGFLVVWYEDRYYGWAQMFGARVSHTGQVLDPQGIEITPYAGYTQFVPELCWDGANYLVAYNMQVSGLDDDVFVTRVSSTGAVLDPGGILVKGGGGAQLGASVAPRVGGGAQIVWTDEAAGGPQPRDIGTAAVTGGGAAGASSSVSLGAPRQSRPRMAAGGPGYLAVFLSETSGQARILAQRLDGSGDELDPEPLLVAGGSAYLTNPSVAWNGSEFLVVWEEGAANSIHGEVKGRRVLPDGTLLDTAAISIIPGNHPDVAALGSTFLVVADDAPGNPHFRYVYSARVGSNGAVLDAPTRIGVNFDVSPSVAALGNRWLVVWENHTTHDNPYAVVMGTFVGTNGVPATAFAVSDGGVDYSPRLAVAGGSALVVWAESDIFGRRILADGTLLGSASGIVVSSAPEMQFAPSVAWDGTRYLVAWLDHRNDPYPHQPRGDIYGARVDVNGSVLDPVGFAIANSELPEEHPTVAAAGGTALFAHAGFFDRAPYAAFRIAIRRFPFDADYSLSSNPTAQTVAPGGVAMFEISVAPVGGFAGTVSFGVFGLPPGVAATFSPPSVTGPGSTTVVVTVSSHTPEEIYRPTIVGSSGARQSTVQVTLVVSANGPAARFSVTDLGTLGGGSYSEAWGLDGSGRVVGFAKLPSGLRHAFVYSGGVMTDLGTLGGAESVAYAINDAGQIAGWSATTGATSHAFLYSGGVMLDLGTFGSSVDDSAAYGINGAGQVAGWAEFTLGAGPHAFLHSGGAKQDLGALGGYWSYAFDVNASGQVAGTASDSSGYARAFLYSDGVLQELGTLPTDFANSYAYGLNDAGQVVGGSTYTNNSATHAVLFSDGGVTDLGTLGGTESLARSINGSGQIVGHSTNAAAVSRAFLYESGTMINLNNLIPADSGWDLSEARGINDAGQIVGKGVIGGQTHGFLLSLETQSLAPPEINGSRFASDKVTLSWTAPAGAESFTAYNVLRGALGELPVGSGPSETCLAPALSGTTSVDPIAPAAGEGFWYLVRGRTAAGAGTYGFQSDGSERRSTSCP